MILLRPRATAATSGATTAPATSPATAASATVGFLAGLVLGLGRVVDEQRVERQRVRQDKVSDRGTADVHCVETDGVLTANRHLDGAKGCVHLWRDRGNGAVDNCSILELYGDCLIGALHKKSNQLHVERGAVAEATV